MNIIKPLYSPFIKPIIIVIKKNGDLRLCLDSKKANEIMIPNYQLKRSIKS